MELGPVLTCRENGSRRRLQPPPGSSMSSPPCWYCLSMF